MLRAGGRQAMLEAQCYGLEVGRQCWMEVAEDDKEWKGKSPEQREIAQKSPTIILALSIYSAFPSYRQNRSAFRYDRSCRPPGIFQRLL